MSSELESSKAEFFQQQIINYWDKHGRKGLPWRRTRNPWIILLTEILLRKTTSAQVNEVFEIISQWTPQQIVDIDFDELVKYLKPLGLSQVRATQLKQIAAGFLDVDQSLFGSDAYLRSFPGIGHYIANSVRCIAFNEPLPALDTNMIRVIQRVFGWVSSRKRLREDRALWAFAETLVPKDRPATYNWAILDFGAAVCTPKHPKCHECPVRSICLFYQSQTEHKEALLPIEDVNIE